MDPNLLNFMLKVERGGGLYNFSYFWDRIFGYWWGLLCFLLFATVSCIFGRLIYYGRLTRDVRLPIFLLRPEVIFIGTTIRLIPFIQLIYLASHEGLFIWRLS
jgi:hypothetical protein